MKIWFMYDNHTFARVGTFGDPIQKLQSRALELFNEDGCGMLCSKGIDNFSKVVHGKRCPDGKYRVDLTELNQFFVDLEEHENWMCR